MLRQRLSVLPSWLANGVLVLFIAIRQDHSEHQFLISGSKRVNDGLD